MLTSAEEKKLSWVYHFGGGSVAMLNANMPDTLSNHSSMIKPHWRIRGKS